MVYDGTAVNGAEWSATQYGYTSVVDRVFSVPAGGPSERSTRCNCKVKQSVGGMTGWNVRLDSLYEDQISIPAGYDETTRWTHGDYAFGDSGSGPQLDTLSTNLRAISDLVGWLAPSTSYSASRLPHSRYPSWQTTIAASTTHAAGAGWPISRTTGRQSLATATCRNLRSTGHMTGQHVEQQDADR